MGDPVSDSSDEFGERESKANFLRCTGDGKINIEQRFRAGNGAHDTKDWRPADGLPEAERSVRFGRMFVFGLHPF